MKKAQAEMIGLMLIVIILAVGLMLYIKFSLTAPSVKESYETTPLGQSFVTSLSQAEMYCGAQPWSISDILKEVARGRQPCGPTTEQDVQSFIESAFVATNGLWGRNYNLTIIRRDSGGSQMLLDAVNLPPFTNPVYPPLERCHSDKSGVVLDYQPIELYPYPGMVELQLYLCP